MRSSWETNGDSRDAPNVSVLIPVRNRPRQILDAIDSCLQQRGVALEVIVVDDGSSDETALVATSVSDPRVRVVRQEAAGVAAARNRAAQAARGHWLLPLDSDDTLLPGAVEDMLAAIADDVDVVCAGTMDVYGDGRTGSRVPARLGAEYGYIRALFLAGAMLIRADAWHEIDGQLVGLTYGENSEMGLRLAAYAERRGGRIVAIPRSTVRRTMPTHHRYDHVARAESTKLTLRHDAALLARSRPAVARLWSICAVQYARGGCVTAALRAQLSACWVSRGSPIHVGRLLVMAIPQLRRRRYAAQVGQS